MIDTVVLYIDTRLFDLDLDSWSQNCKKSNFYTIYKKNFKKLSIHLYGMWSTFEACLCDEPHSFCLGHSVFKGENPADTITLKKEL